MIKEYCQPDYSLNIHFLHESVDESSLFAVIVNNLLRKNNSRKRVRKILFSDEARATGIWTPEQAKEVITRMEFDSNDNFHDPQKRKGLLRPFQYFGLIK